jgi:hypothetical protein
VDELGLEEIVLAYLGRRSPAPTEAEPHATAVAS